MFRKERFIEKDRNFLSKLRSFSGGADENRTRVRKQIHTGFSERRLCVTFPRSKLHNQSYDLGSSLFMTEAGTSSVHVHHSHDARAYAVVLTGRTTLQLGSVS